MPCPIARSLERVGEWWSILILRDAFRGLTRFDQFQKSLDIAPNMLTRRLNALVESGLLERRALQRAPAARRIRADRARPRFPAGAVGAARLGQPAFRPRGPQRHRRSTPRPASRPTRCWWTAQRQVMRSRVPIAPDRRRDGRGRARVLPTAPRTPARSAVMSDQVIEREIARPTAGIRAQASRASSSALAGAALLLGSAPHGTATTGGPSAASSRAPTMPMSAATSRDRAEGRRLHRRRSLVTDNQSGPRRRSAGETGRSATTGGAAIRRRRCAAARQQATLANLEAERRLQEAMIAQAKAELDRERRGRDRPHQDDVERYRSLAQDQRRLAPAALSAGGRGPSKALAGRLPGRARRLEAAQRQLDVHRHAEAAGGGGMWPARSPIAIPRSSTSATPNCARRSTATVGNRSARTGAYATIGAQLISLVPAHGLWVDANFKESQLARMRAGRCR